MKNEKKKVAIISFLKEAFCVDGDVTFALPDENLILNDKKHYWIRLVDSKRGTFFITIYNPK